MHEYMRKEDINAFGYRKQLVDCSSESFVEESAGQPFKKKKSDILPKFNQEKEFLDDSFNNLIPVSNEVIGRNDVKNYERKKDVITPPPEAIQYSNKN